MQTDRPVNRPRQTKEEVAALYVRIRAGGIDGRLARDEMIMANMPLVLWWLKRWLIKWPQGRRHDFDDLVQEGNAGLVIAVDRFKPELGFRFSTYAYSWIWHEIEIFIRNDRLEHLSRAGWEKGDRRRRVFAMAELNSDVVLDYLCAEDRPHDGPVGHAELWVLIDHLSEPDRTVLAEWLGAFGRPQAVREIARDLAVKREQVQYIRNRAVRQVRDLMRCDRRVVDLVEALA
jgi:RNA polymerase sigma factor (sigma-70 family)